MWRARSELLLRPFQNLMMVYTMSISLLLVVESKQRKQEDDSEESKMLLSDFSLES